MFPDEAAQHLLQVGCHPVEVEHLGLRHLPPAESQQLLGQRRGPFGGLEDIVTIFIEGVIFHEAGPDELAVAHDGHQEVVEIVGHAAGQPAHRLHLLGLEELGLQGLAFGDVQPQFQDQGGAINVGKGVIVDMIGSTLGGGSLPLHRLLGLQDFPDVALIARRWSAMNEFVAGAAFGVTEDLPELTVSERHRAVRRHETD